MAEGRPILRLTAAFAPGEPVRLHPEGERGVLAARTAPGEDEDG